MLQEEQKNKLEMNEKRKSQETKPDILNQKKKNTIHMIFKKDYWMNLIVDEKGKEIENRAIEIIQSEEKKENKMKKE